MMPWKLATRPNRPIHTSMCNQPELSPEVNEFELARLTPVASKVIKVPRVGESPVSFECKVTQIIQLQRADKELVPSWLVLGEVVAVHIAKWLLKDGIYDTAAAEPILRGGGPADYFQLGPEALFKMYRPGACHRLTNTTDPNVGEGLCGSGLARDSGGSVDIFIN